MTVVIGSRLFRVASYSEWLLVQSGSLFTLLELDLPLVNGFFRVAVCSECLVLTRK